MQSVRIFRVATATLLGVLLLTTVGAAKDGRDFAGFYSITNVIEHLQNTLQNKVLTSRPL